VKKNNAVKPYIMTWDVLKMLFLLQVNLVMEAAVSSKTLVSKLLKYKVVSESSRTLIVVTALVKEDERGGQGHISASLLHQSAT
jgi:hypothetical protein